MTKTPVMAGDASVRPHNMKNPASPADNAYEIKADDPLMQSFDTLADAEQQGKAIATLSEEMDSVKSDIGGLKNGQEQLASRMDKIARAAQRPAIGDSNDKNSASPESKSFINGYLRKGLERELKSFNGATSSDGGYAVPQEIDAAIGRMLTQISPIRSLATVVRTGSAGYRKLVTQGGTPSGWVSELAARPESDTPDFAEIAPPTGELYANPAASQAMLDDAAFDVESWLAAEIAQEFARAEGAAFVNGSGNNQPKGFLKAPVSTNGDGNRPFGTVQVLASGADGDFASDNPDEALIDLVHSLKSGYRQGASFVMNSATLAKIRKFKTSDGAFLWQPSLSAGQPATLLGYPVVEAEDMPDMDSDSLSIAFGNFRAAYLIAERSMTSILRDPFTNKPFVHFYATKRIGGQLMNSEAVKYLQFSAD